MCGPSLTPGNHYFQTQSATASGCIYPTKVQPLKNCFPKPSDMLAIKINYQYMQVSAQITSKGNSVRSDDPYHRHQNFYQKVDSILPLKTTASNGCSQ
ncbi:hypothetical protein AVEN_200094-1 [Araneus ventricosus]|uniref:Uncharacterized protein n=1 Tax=Araneus ventricosus TaxID=182803 RepID=A0A4Y2UYH2_ARAVE|nr:hypothetical protein AVEN_200094-1 [Araneus ventricosus]